MVKLDFNEPTEEEHEQKAITNLRYMQVCFKLLTSAGGHVTLIRDYLLEKMSQFQKTIGVAKFAIACWKWVIYTGVDTCTCTDSIGCLCVFCNYRASITTKVVENFEML
jgi:hypothetical protein